MTRATPTALPLRGGAGTPPFYEGAASAHDNGRVHEGEGVIRLDDRGVALVVDEVGQQLTVTLPAGRTTEEQVVLWSEGRTHHADVAATLDVDHIAAIADLAGVEQAGESGRKRDLRRKVPNRTCM